MRGDLFELSAVKDAFYSLACIAEKYNRLLEELQFGFMALVCYFSTIPMALKLISHNPNSTYGSGF